MEPFWRSTSRFSTGTAKSIVFLPFLKATSGSFLSGFEKYAKNAPYTSKRKFFLSEIQIQIQIHYWNPPSAYLPARDKQIRET